MEEGRSPDRSLTDRDKRLRRRQQRKNQEDNNQSSSTTKSKHSSPSSPPQTVAGGKGEDKSSQGQDNDRALAIATPTGAGDIDLEKGNDGDDAPTPRFSSKPTREPQRASSESLTTNDSQIVVFGSNDSYQTGTGSRDVMEYWSPVRTLSDITASINELTAGDSHAVALTVGGKVFTWGGSGGKLMRLTSMFDDEENEETLQATPTEIELPIISAVSAGGEHTALVTCNNDVWTFGSFRTQDGGEVNLAPDPSKPFIPKFDNKPEDAHIMEVKSGRTHVAVRFSTGQVHTMGLVGAYLGQGEPAGNNSDDFVFKDVLWDEGERPNVIGIACGDTSTYALTDDGDVYCCGSNGSGELGLGDNEPRSVMTRIQFPNGKRILQVDVGVDHAIFLTFDGHVFTCGNGRNGELGTGEYKDTIHCQRRPEEVHLPKCCKGQIINIAAGQSFSMFATLSAVYSFGLGTCGRLGQGDEDNYYTPKKIEAIPPKSTIVSIDAGGWNGFIKFQGRAIPAPPDRTLIPFFGADEELEIAAPTPEDSGGDKEGSGDKAPKTQWSPGFLQRNAQQKRCPECSMILLADGKCECQKVKDNDIDNDNDNDNRTLEAASASIGQAGFTFQLPATDQSNEGNRKETLEAASASIGPSGFTFQPPATDRSNEGDSNKTPAAASASIGPSGFTFQPPATDRSNEGDSNKTLAAASASIGPSGFTFQPTMFPEPDDDCDTQYDAEEKKHQDEQQQPVQQQEEEGVVATPEQTREVDGTTSTSASASGTTTTPPVEGVVSQNLSRHSSTPGSVANDEQAGVEADDEDVALDESKADAAIFVLGIDNIKAPEPPVQKDVEEVEDEDAGLTPDVIAGLSYNELRSTCKSHGLPANGKALDLKERLLQHCSSSQGNVEEKEEDEEEEKQTEQVDGKGDDGNDKSMETDDTREEGIESSEGAQKEEDEDSGLTTTTTEGTGANSNIDSTYTFDMNSSYGKQFMEMAIALFLQNDNGSRSVSVRDSSSDLMDEVRSFIATECSLSFAQGGMPATDDAIHVFLTNAIEKVIRVAADLSGRGRRISFPKDVAMAFFFNHAFPGESTVSPPSDCSCSTVQFVRFKPAEVEGCLQLQVKYVDHPGYFDIEAKDLCTRHYIEFEPLMQILATLLKSRRANIPVGCRAEVSASINRSAMPLSDCVKKCVMMLPDSLISDDEKRTLEPLLSDKSFDIAKFPNLLCHNVGHVGARREKDHSTSGGDGIDHKAMSMGGHMLGVFASGQTLHCVYIDGENNQITDPVAEYGTRDRTSDGLADLDIDRFLKLYSVLVFTMNIILLAYHF